MEMFILYLYIALLSKESRLRTLKSVTGCLTQVEVRHQVVFRETLSAERDLFSYSAANITYSLVIPYTSPAVRYISHPFSFFFDFFFAIVRFLLKTSGA